MADDALPFGKDRKPDLAKPGPRSPLSKFEFAVKFLEQQGRCYLCNGKLERGKVIDEHDPPRETMPAAICDNLEFRKLACRACAKAKTIADQGVIAKQRRIRGEKGQRARRAKNGPQIQSRGFPQMPETRDPKKWQSAGFDKTRSRGFDGKVRERAK